MLNQDTLREATRLTQAGQLTEATSLLQRMLRGERAPAAASPAPGHICLPGLTPLTIDLRSQRRRRPRRSCGRADRPTAAPAVVRPRQGRHLARLAGCQARACFNDRHRAGGSGVHRRHLQQPGGKPNVQALRPHRLSWAAASADRYASRMHPVAPRFRRGYANELPCRRTKVLRGLSCTVPRIQPVEMLELVSRSRSATRRR